MGISTGMVAFKLAYQASPIILSGGVAQNMPGGILPLIVLTQGIAFSLSLLSGGNIDIDNYWANFEPLPGATLIRNKFGLYPFANQTVAANAVISDVVNVSMLMKVPASAAGGYLTKLAVMTALVATLQQHSISGGTYTIATPSYFFTNCLLAELRDVSPAVSKQTQIAWQWDFIQPLLTQNSAQNAQNSLMSRLTNGGILQSQDGGSLGDLATANSPQSGATTAISPAAASTPASSVSTIYPSNN